MVFNRWPHAIVFLGKKMGIDQTLHKRFNRDNSQISPVRIRGFKRADLIKLFAELGFKRGAEVGVEKGKFSKYIWENIPDVHLLGVDPWVVYEEDQRLQTKGEKVVSECYIQAVKRYSQYDNATMCRMISMEGVREVEKDSLDFVYIDGNHQFDFVIQDLIEWSKRVKAGGIVAGHDYYRFRWAGVIEAVDIYTRMHRVYNWYLTDDRTPSFFWVKK